MAYDLTPLNAAVDTFEALARGLQTKLLDSAVTTDIASFAAQTRQATDPLLAAATLLTSYVRTAIADLDARASAAEAKVAALEARMAAQETQGADHESRIAALEAQP